MRGIWSCGRVVGAMGIVSVFAFSAAVQGARSIHINNPSFEVGGTAGTAIDGWSSSDDALTSTTAATYTFFDGSRVANISNTGSTVALGQTISGLDTSKKYVISYQGSTTILGAVQQASYAGLAMGKTGGTGYAWSGVFTPPSSSGTLSLTNVVSGGDVQFDAINVRAVMPNEVVTAIFDPSFEGSDSTSADGATSRIAGWNSTGVTGINPNLFGQSSYADNGMVPDGDKVAYLKATPGQTASLALATGVHALTPGVRYELKFRYNAADGAGNMDPARMTVTIGSINVVQDLVVTPVGDDGQYYTFDTFFTATSTRDPWLTISNVDVGDTGSSALLIDDLIVTTPEPRFSGLLAVIGSVMVLQRRRSFSANRNAVG